MIDFYQTSACDLVKKIKEGSLKAVDVVQASIDKINKENKKLNAFVYLNDDAIKQAERIDKKREEGKPLGKLAGIPIAIKDNMCQKDTLTTSCSKILANYKPPYNATVVEKILAEDGIIVGKTNMDEFAMGSSNENSCYGAVSNPFDLERIPGGSSGGSAVAVSAGLVPLALGSDTGGSIRQPAAMCGVIGLKPTYGSVSRYGLMSYSSSLDQIGPFARNIDDIALLYNAISGYDPKDSSSVNNENPKILLDNIKSLKGFKIGLVPSFMTDGLSPDVRTSLLATAEKMKELGAEIIDVDLPHAKYGIAAYYLVATAEASSNLGRYDGIHYGYRSSESKDLHSVYFNSRSEGFGTEVKRRILLGTFSLSSGYYDQFYNKSTKVRRLILNDYLNAFKKVDAILTPTAPSVAFKKGEKTSNPVEMYLSDVYTVCNNLSGVPGISFNCGTSKEGLPIGAQLTGPVFEEKKLLEIIKGFENSTQHHLLTPNI